MMSKLARFHDSLARLGRGLGCFAHKAQKRRRANGRREHRTLNIEHPTSNGACIYAFNVGRLDVRCWMFGPGIGSVFRLLIRVFRQSWAKLLLSRCRWRVWLGRSLAL